MQGILHEDQQQAFTIRAQVRVPSRKATCDGYRWFQLYWYAPPLPPNLPSSRECLLFPHSLLTLIRTNRPRNNDVTIPVLRRAKVVGFTVLVVTLDTFLLGWCPHDLDRSFFSPSPRASGGKSARPIPSSCNDGDYRLARTNDHSRSTWTRSSRVSHQAASRRGEPSRLALGGCKKPTRASSPRGMMISRSCARIGMDLSY